MSGNYSGAPALTFLSTGDSGSPAPEHSFRASQSPRATPFVAQNPQTEQQQPDGLQALSPRQYREAAEASWAPGHASPPLASLPQLGSSHAEGGLRQFDAGIEPVASGGIAQVSSPAGHTSGDSREPGLDVAEHGLVGREDSDILTQAAVDAMQPRRSVMARRPSVVQFAGLASAAAAAVGAAGAAVAPASAAVAPGWLTGSTEAANVRFKKAGKAAMAASQFRLALQSTHAASFRHASGSQYSKAGSDGGSREGGPSSQGSAARLPPDVSWRIKAKAALAARVANRKSLLGEGAFMRDRSLGLFGIRNPLRLAVFKILYSQVFDYVLAAAILIHLIAITSESGQPHHSTAVYVLDIMMLCFYAVEAVARTLALGFWRGRNAYLRSTYNQLDFLVIVSSWALKAVSWSHYKEPIYPGVLRAFRMVLCLRSFSGVAAIIATLECTGEALPELVEVFLFTGMAALLFGLAGVQLFAGALGRGCVLATGPGTSNWTQANPPWLCGDITLPGEPTPVKHKGYACPQEQGQFCTPAVGDPNYGNTGFDNLGQAALIMVQTLSYESWEYNMWNNIDADYQYASVYYILYILLGPFILINVYLAAISSVFLQLRRRNKILLDMSRRQKTKRHARLTAAKASGGNSSLGPGQQLLLESETSGRMALVKGFLASLARTSSSFHATTSFADGRIKPAQVLPAGNSAEQLQLQPRSYSMTSRASSEGHSAIFYVPSSLGHFSSLAMRLSEYTRLIVASLWFHYGTGLLVLGNLIVMCLYTPGDTSSRAGALHTAELAFAGVFLAEALLRIAASGYAYFWNAGELFDLAIIVASLTALTSGKFPNLNMARIFRYVRALGRNKRGRGTVVFKLLSSWGSVLGLFTFLFLVIAVFAMFAMQLFGSHYDNFGGGHPRQNFDTFPQAWLTIFQVTSSDTWMSITWEAMRPQWSAALFFAPCWMFTNVVVINLVIALVLEQFRLRDHRKLAIQRREVLKAVRTIQVPRNTLVGMVEATRVRGILLWNAQKWSRSRAAKHSAYFARIMEAEAAAARHRVEESDSEEDVKQQRKKLSFTRSSQLQLVASGGSFTSSIFRSESRAAEEMIHLQLRKGIAESAELQASEVGQQGEEPSRVLEPVEVVKRAPLTSVVMKREYGKQMQYRRASLVVLAALQDLDDSAKERRTVLPAYMRDKSMGLFTPESRPRQIAALVSESFWYRWVSMGVIGVSIIAVIWTPNSSDAGPDTHAHNVRAMNYLTALFFAVDALMQMVAQGVLFTPSAYFQNVWHWIDSAILLIDLLRLGTYTGYRQRWLLALTSFRSFRVMVRQPTIRNLMTALLKTMGPIATVFLLALSLFVMFALLAIRLFGEKLYSCNDGAITTGRQDCIGNFYNGAGILMPRVWDKPDYNFDSLGKAILTLFELGTLDNWGDCLFAVMDITGFNQQPRQNAGWQNAIFFIVFVCVSAHFMIKSFVAVFCEQFETITGNALLTDKQKAWRNITKAALRLKPVRLRRPPASELKARCFRFVESEYFRQGIVSVILINMGFLASYSYAQSNTWNDVLNGVDAGFTVIYLLEVLLKWQAAGSLWRWLSYWNALEACLAIGSIVTVFPTAGTTRASVSRPFGFVRIVRVVRYVRGMRTVVNTLLLSGTAMLTILSSILIVIFAYAGIGVQIFASIKYRLNLNRQVNFHSFSNAFLFLFQVLTGENWRYTMNDIKNGPPYCTTAPPDGRASDCGTSAGGSAFFVTFIILNSYLLTNLFVAAIMEFVVSGLLRQGAIVTTLDLETFQAVWAIFDPSRTGLIGLHRFRSLLAALKAARCPLASRALSRAWERPILYQAWHSHLPNKGLQFADAMLLLLHDKFGRNALTYDVRKERDREVKDFMRGGAAAVIQAHTRGYLTRRQVARIKARRADPDRRRHRRHRDRSRSPHKRGHPSGSSRGGGGDEALSVNADSHSDSQLNPLAAALLSIGSAQKWPERREELQQEAEDNPYQQISRLPQVNGRPVLGSLEMMEGPAPSGLMSGQPRRLSPRLGSPRVAVSDTRTETAAFGVDHAMSFRLPAWTRLNIEPHDTEEASAGASGAATAQPAGPAAVAVDLVDTSKSARGTKSRAGSGIAQEGGRARQSAVGDPESWQESDGT